MSTLRQRSAHRRSKRSSCFASILLAVFCRALAAQEPVDDEKLLLVAVRIDREILADSVPAYPLDGGLLLPLGEVCELVQFAIRVDPLTRTARGFFIDETRQFHLDLAKSEVEVGGATHRLDPRKAIEHDGDIYVDAALLGTWFPIDVRVDLFGAMVSLQPRETLPFQRQRERERAAAAAAGSRGPRDILPLVRSPYALLAAPFVDQQIRIRHGGGRALVQYTTLVTGDLLACEAALFLTGGNEKPLDELRGSLGRRDPEARLLGPLHAREVVAGDVLLPGSDLVTSTVRGTGAIVSNFPLDRAITFTEQTLTGELPPGWDAELYLNDALIGFQRSEGGRYEFANVPVLYGFNAVRLELYGPRGERRQEIRNHHIGETLTPPGVLHYRVGSASPDLRARRESAELSWGVSPSFSVAAFAARVGREHFATAGVRVARHRVFAYLDAGGSGDGGRIARAGVQARLGGLSVAATRAQLTGLYASETYRSSLGTIASRTTFRAGGALFRRTSHPLPVTVDVQRDVLAEGGSITRASALVSAIVRRTWLSHRLDGLFLRGVTSPLAGEDSVSGAVLVSRSLRGLTLRADAEYELRPQRRATGISLLAELPRYRRTQVTAEISRGVGGVGGGITRAIARVRRDVGPAGVALAVEVPSRGSPTLHFELTTSLIPNPITRRAAFRARPAAAGGAFAARVFLDENANGRRDGGEPPIANAGFFVNRNSVTPQTNADGIVMLDDLPAYTATDVRLSVETLDDPWWHPVRAAVRTIPRPGKAVVVDFPIAVTGEITGIVSLQTARRTSPARGVRVQLVDPAGMIVREEPSGHDGFYDLTRIPPGEYTLRIHPGDVAKYRLTGDAGRPVRIITTKNVLDGLDLVGIVTP